MGMDSWISFLRLDAPVTPAITLHFEHSEASDEDPIVSVAIFHKVDGNLGGIKIHNQVSYPRNYVNGFTVYRPLFGQESNNHL